MPCSFNSTALANEIIAENDREERVKKRNGTKRAASLPRNCRIALNKLNREEKQFVGPETI